MQTSKEYREQLEWFWLFSQEEAWQESQEVKPKWELVKTRTYQGGVGGRSYSTEKVISEHGTWREAQDLADQLNTTASPSLYYSILRVE